MTVDGRAMRGDVTIVRGAARDGWRRGRGHLVTAGDLADVLAANPRVLVVGTGASGLMKVDDSLRRAAEDAGAQLIAKPTRQAVDEFNALEKKGENVAGAFHLTC